MTVLADDEPACCRSVDHDRFMWNSNVAQSIGRFKRHRAAS
jgi:hypothetical protein